MTTRTTSYELIKQNLIVTKPEEESAVSKGPRFGKRHVITLILFLLIETTHTVKVYMTVCIVAMTDPKGNSDGIPTYNWKNTGVILSGYIWGLCLSPIFAGWLVTKFKVKWLVVFMLILCSIAGFLIPTIAYHVGSAGVVICRIIQGATMGTMGPFVFYYYGKWFPPSERGSLVAFVYSGQTIGVVVSMSISGQLAATKYGWTSVIYFYSSLCLLWCIIFAYLAFDSPAEHPTISEEEKFYIQRSLSQVKKKNLIPPYKKIFTSRYIWANISARVGGNFSYYFMLSEVSTYLRDILHINIQSNGLFSTAPFVGTIFVTFFCGFLSDFLSRKGTLSRTTIRKLIAGVGCVVPIISLLLLAYCKSGETVKVIVLLSLCSSLAAGTAAQSTLLNSIDLAPNHAAIIEGTINQISMITASGGPLLVQFIVSDKTRNLEQWRIIFYIVAGIKFVTMAIFLIFGSAETQPWNEEICKTEKDLPYLKKEEEKQNVLC